MFEELCSVGSKPAKVHAEFWLVSQFMLIPRQDHHSLPLAGMTATYQPCLMYLLLLQLCVLPKRNKIFYMKKNAIN